MNFLRHKCPTRPRYPHRFEKSPGERQDISHEWCYIASKTWNYLNKLRQTDAQAVDAFERYFLRPKRPGIEELEDLYGRSDKTIWRWIARIKRDLHDHYIALEILDKKEK